MTLALSVKDLRVEADGQSLLNISALDVPAGGTLGVCGPSGAGKSTFLMALAGMMPSVCGQVLWGDTDVLALRQSAAAAFRLNHFGLIFQDHKLFEELSAEGNAALMGALHARQTRAMVWAGARAALKRFGVPEGARNVATFSGGERQRIAVARALANTPAVVLADEPTASLDAETGAALTADLIAACKDTGATLVTVSHDAVVLDAMDGVLTLEDGRPV